MNPHKDLRGKGIAAVDDRRRHIEQEVCEHAGLGLNDLHFLIEMRDVGFIRHVALVGIKREKTRGFKQLQRTAAVGQIRRNGNLVAVLDVGALIFCLLLKTRSGVTSVSPMATIL